MALKRGAQPGNRNNSKGRAWYDALRIELGTFSDKGRGVEVGQALRKIAKKCVEQALDGDDKARTEIANRLDGKPKETIDATFSHAVAQELTDAELLDIARSSGDGAVEAQTGEADDSSIH